MFCQGLQFSWSRNKLSDFSEANLSLTLHFSSEEFRALYPQEMVHQKSKFTPNF